MYLLLKMNVKCLFGNVHVFFEIRIKCHIALFNALNVFLLLKKVLKELREILKRVQLALVVPESSYYNRYFSLLHFFLHSLLHFISITQSVAFSFEEIKAL